MLYALLLFQHHGSVYITVYIFQKTVFDIYVAACTLPIYWLPVKEKHPTEQTVVTDLSLPVNVLLLRGGENKGITNVSTHLSTRVFLEPDE